MDRQYCQERATAYLNLHRAGVAIKAYLGGGTDGEVWSTTKNTAVKAFKVERGYCNERDAYLRLREFGVLGQIQGFWLPTLRGYDDALWVIEMDVMHDPPYIIDFAKVRIDRPPDFSLEVMQDVEERGREEFERHWPKVKALLAALESYQIYYLDPRPGNIVFPELS
jgi:hypothetical protein